jgi:WD40 repeat protein
LNPLRFFFGRDVFISYSRGDAATYAPSLGRELASRRLTYYLDQEQAPPGRKLPLSLVRHLRRADIVVIVASPCAVTSSEVAKELTIALERPDRVFVPIDVEKGLAGARWDVDPWRRIDGAARVVETEEQALKSGKVSEAVVRRIESVSSATRQETRLRRSVVTAIAVIALAAAIAVWFLIAARTQERRALANILAAQATSGGISHQLALLFAAESFDTRPTDPSFVTQAALFSLIHRYPRMQHIIRGELSAAAPDSPANAVGALTELPGGGLAWGDERGYVRSYDASTREMKTWGRHEAKIIALAASADGSLIVSESDTGDVQLWNTRSGTAPARLSDMRIDRGTSFAFTRDHRLLWIDEGKIAVTDVRDPANPRRLAPLAVDGDITSFVQTDDGALIVGERDGRLSFAGARRGTIPADDAAVAKILVSRGASSLIVSMDDRQGVFVADIAKHTRAFELPQEPNTRDVALDPTGRYLAAARGTENERRVNVWRTSDFGLKDQLMWPSTATALAFTKDGWSIIVGYQDGSVVWWSLDARTQPASTTLALGRKDAESFRFTRDGATLVRLDQNGRVTGRVNVPGCPPGTAEPLAIATPTGVRDATSGRVLLTPEPHVTDVAVSGDGRVAATLSTTPKSETGETLHIGIWDVERKRRTKTFDAGVRWASHLALDKTGSLLAIGGFDERIAIWDVATQQMLQEFAVADPVTQVAISPDGAVVAVQDGLHLTLFDRAAGLPLATLPSFGGNVAFSPDGTTLAISRRDSIELLSMEPRVWRDAAHRTAGRPLTLAERQRYLGVLAKR